MCLTGLLKSPSSGHIFLLKTGLRKGVWRDWCSEMGKASQFLLVTDMWAEAGRAGPVMSEEETDSSAGTRQALDHGPPPRVRPAPQAVPPAHSQTTAKHEHKVCPTSGCRYPSGITNTKQEEYIWVGWGIRNSVFAFFFYYLIAATLLLLFHEERTPSILVATHPNFQSIMH